MLYGQKEIFRNAIMYYIALGLADSVFQGYKTVEDILKARIPDGHRSWLFRLTDKARNSNLPVLLMVNDNGLTGKSLKYKSMHTQLVFLGFRAGYQERITAHAIRRPLGTLVDQDYTDAQRNHLFGQSNTVFEKDYLARRSAVDGQAVMNKQPSRRDHIDFMMDLGIKHVEDLTSLPALWSIPPYGPFFRLPSTLTAICEQPTQYNPNLMMDIHYLISHFPHYPTFPAFYAFVIACAIF